MIKAGQFRHNIQILAPTPNRDAYGENIQTWTPILCTRASIEQLRGSLLTLAQARASTAIASHVITIRYNPAVVETCRVQYGTSIYTITSILDPDTRRRQLNLLCSLVTA